MVQKIMSYLTRDIWRVRIRTLPRLESFLVHHIRIIMLALRGFAEDKCQLRASALTFYSLLSIVPVVAMAFGIAKGFGFENTLEQQLIENLQGQEEVIARIIEFARKMLDNTKGGLIAGIGVGLLFWTVIQVLGNIELSFNDIWGVKTARSLIRKFSDYLAIMLICPLLLMASSSLTIFIKSQVELITHKISLLGALSPLIFSLLSFLPYTLLWILFSFIYIIMPNTRVTIKSGIFAGVIGGTIYQLAQWLYITFQLGASKYGAIYGSFAALPLFLVWLQTSWLVVLFGAELSFAHQNVDTYEFEPDCLSVSTRFKNILSLYITHLVIKHFMLGSAPRTAAQLSDELDIPIRLVNQLLFDLVQAGILIEIKNKADERIPLYHPARDPDLLTIQYVLDALDTLGADSLPVQESKELQLINAAVSSFAASISKLPANVLLKKL